MRCHSARSSVVCVFRSRVGLLLENLAGCTTRRRTLARKKAAALNLSVLVQPAVSGLSVHWLSVRQPDGRGWVPDVVKWL